MVNSLIFYFVDGTAATTNADSTNNNINNNNNNNNNNSITGENYGKSSPLNKPK
jgi:hypothetical protein